MTRAIRFACVAVSLLLFAAGIAEAQGVRKFVTPDGKTIYSDVPIPGAREVDGVALPPEVDPEALGRAREAARREAELARDTENQMQESATRQARIEAAEANLKSARATLASEKEPRPGERKGIGGGKTRLTDAYFQRQNVNKRAVENAQKKLDAARAKR